MPTSTSRSVEAARQLQLDLLGAAGTANAFDSPDAFLPLMVHRGVCRACGTRTDMSFEHMPPAAPGTSIRPRGTSSLGTLSSAVAGNGWFASQRGMGAYVLCAPCHEFLGDEYVRAYVAFADGIGQAAMSAIQHGGFIPETLVVNLHGWRLGDIARAGWCSSSPLASTTG